MIEDHGTLKKGDRRAVLSYQYHGPPDSSSGKGTSVLGACPRLAIVTKLCWFESDFSIV